VSCSRASLYVFDETGRGATLLATDMEGEDKIEIGTRSPLEFYGDAEGLLQSQVAVEVDLIGQSRLPMFLQYLRACGVRSCARVPLNAQGTTLGFIYLSRIYRGSFSPDHLAIARELADQIGIALQQARLREQVQNHTLELQRQRDFAENLIDTAQVIVLVLDREGQIISFNPYMETLSGYHLAEVRGRSWLATFIPERLRNRVRVMISEAIRSPQTYRAINPRS